MCCNAGPNVEYKNVQYHKKRKDAVDHCKLATVLFFNPVWQKSEFPSWCFNLGERGDDYRFKAKRQKVKTPTVVNRVIPYINFAVFHDPGSNEQSDKAPIAVMIEYEEESVFYLADEHGFRSDDSQNVYLPK